MTITNDFSKFWFRKPLKDKKGEKVAKSFEIIFERGSRKPEKVWSDKETEFYNRYVLTRSYPYVLV